MWSCAINELREASLADSTPFMHTNEKPYAYQRGHSLSYRITITG